MLSPRAELQPALTAAGLFGRPFHEQHARGSVDELLQTHIEIFSRVVTGDSRKGSARRMALHFFGQLGGMRTV